jgi:lipid-binding SYLF domain-containing protein/peptidoglycan hydrolase-like protein with peptidoglycan-binding domain
MMFIRKLLFIVAVGLLPLPNAVFTGEEKAKAGKNRDSVKISDEAERALSAANVVREMVGTPETSIPDALLERAQAIAVVPKVVKAALGVGGSFGKGLVARRTGQGWGAPAFIDLSGGSFGFQIGVESIDLVLVFTKEEGLKGLLEDKLQLGAEAGVAAGPLGRTAAAGTNVTFDSPIYSYSRSKGLFAGIALKGSVMTIDDSANHKVYGKEVSGKDILLRGEVAPTRVVRPFVEALQTYRAQAISEKGPAGKRTTAAGAAREQKQRAAVSDEIKKVQEALRDKGYDPGPIDGVLGPRTRAALRSYQQAENLAMTGRLDPETAAKLGGRSETGREEREPTSPAAADADNTARNQRDRSGANQTSGDQAENPSDRQITASIRRAVVADKSLSTNAHNVKIITSNGMVRLRGPVKTAEEKAAVEAKAKQVAGVKSVTSHLEVEANP